MILWLFYLILVILSHYSEAWTLYSKQAHRLHTFHIRCLRRLLGVTWKDHITNEDALKRSGSPSMKDLLQQRRLWWLGHVCRMEDGRIPKDLLFSQLATGTRPRGRPQLRYKDLCKRNLLVCGLSPAELQSQAADRAGLRQRVNAGVKAASDARARKEKEKKTACKQMAASAAPSVTLACKICGRPCLSRIGLISNQRRCNGQSWR